MSTYIMRWNPASSSKISAFEAARKKMAQRLSRIYEWEHA